MRHATICRRLGIALTLLLTLATGQGFAREQAIRLRIAWGGGGERIWAGRISIDEGTLREPRPLGIEADEPGSMWMDQGQLVVLQRSPRTYDAVDLLVDGPSRAKLTVDLSVVGAPPGKPPLVIPLGDLLGDSVGAALDDQGNRLLVERSPGDALRVSVGDGPMLLAPGQTFKLTLKPHRLPVKSGSRVKISVTLVRGRGSKPLWTTQHEFDTERPRAIPLEIPLANEEGVHELVITATRNHRPGWPPRLRKPLGWAKTVSQRRVQVLVLSPERPEIPVSSQETLVQVVQIDPANPKWFERFAKLPQLPGLPRLWQEPLGNDQQDIWEHPLGKFARLKPSRQTTDASWEAYSLPIERPGKPHVLEVEYPSDVAQTLGISIIEPNAAGAVMPIGLDSGVHRVEEGVDRDRRPRRLVHRVIFWPRTKTPMVLIANRQSDAPAVYGQIRVLGGWNHLPRAYPVDDDDGPKRLLAGCLERPLFPENFSATESPLTLSDRSLDDWVTFHQGGTRLVEYLNHVGHGGLMISVMADGSTIYPSRILEPTPRYDTGILFDTAVDPVRKDVLEMLLRMFDRDRLQLIPAMEFASPLPPLEEILRRGGPESRALTWIGPEGTTWVETYGSTRGLAPYYNVLHPQVQQVMLDVVRELLDRYGGHPSLTGLALQLSAHGFAQLPGPEWGMDDVTIARFEQDTGIEVPGAGTKRFAQRAEFLTGPHRQAWLSWRAGQLTRFYRRIDAELKKVCPQGRLYLAGAGIFRGPELEQRLRPALGRRTTVAETLLAVGIDVEQYRRADGPVLLRPEPFCPSAPAIVRAMNLEISQMADWDRQFAAFPAAGSLFVQQPEQFQVPSFDRKSPFRRSHTALFTHPVASDRQNRRRFVHSLATIDAQWMFDGGWLLPLGQEDAIRDLVAAYRRLPAIRFQSVAEPIGRRSLQPVTIRYATHQGQTYVYVVNDAPVAVTAAVHLDAPIGCRLEELSGMRSVEPLRYDGSDCHWSVDLEPYDLVAVRLGSPDVKLFGPEVSVPESFQEVLKTRIRDLGTRAATLRSPPPLGVPANPGFEKRPGSDDGLPGWATSKKNDVSIELDSTRRHGGVRSVRLSSTGPVACLVSEPFAAPKTGRFSMLVWLRVADAASQPPLRLAVEWDRQGRDYRFAQIGRAAAGQDAVPIGEQWAPYIFQVYDLPLEGVSQLRVRFDLMGAGEVWIDDVQLSDLAFSRTELVELSKLITVANGKLQRGQLGDCLRLLEGYWPRFLEANVPLAPEAVARKPRSTQPASKPSRQPERTSGVVDRMRGLLPRSLRF